MITGTIMSKNKKIVSVLFVAFAIALIPGISFARSENENAATEIKYYDPNASNCSGGGGNWSENCGEVSGSNRTELLHSYIDNYAGVAINLQIEYGIPWEAFFFHICGESNCGDITLEGSMAKWVYDDLGGYNLAGMHGKGGPYATGTYVTNSNNHDFANHATIQDNIAAFVVSIMRNGAYDNALKYGDYNNFDLKQFLTAEISMYICGEASCPRASNYGGWLMLDEIENYAKAQGIPSSKEVANQYHITEGGKHPDHGNMQSQLGWENFSQHYECAGSKVEDEESTDESPTIDESEAGSAVSDVTETQEPPEEAKTPTSDTSDGSDPVEKKTMSENGLTFEQAQKLVDYFKDPAHNSEYDLRMTMGVHCNCTSMSNYFTQMYTTLTYGGGDGQFVARQTANANPEYTELITSGRPKIPSIFSTGVGSGGSGHTGVIVGYDESTDEYITIEAGWAGGVEEQTGINEGACARAADWYASAGAAIRHDLSYWTNGSYNFAYIMPEAINTEKLLEVAGGAFGSGSCRNKNNAFTGDFKFLSQCDTRWSNESYQSGTVCSSGCGLVSFTMIANYLDNTNLTPVEMRDKVNQDWPGNMEATGAAATMMGYKTVDVSRTENVKYNATVQQIVDAIDKYLDDGYVIELSGHINASSKGAQWVCTASCKYYNDLFSSNGHYIVLYGKDSSGKWLLADPGNKDNWGKALDPTDAVERGIRRTDGSTNIYGVKK